MDSPIIARGTGYENDTTFDGFEVIAEPLATRESRVFNSSDGRPGVTYASHSLKLARRAADVPSNRSPDLFVLMQHGAGRRVIKLHLCYHNREALPALLALPEAALYGVLYGFATAVEAADYAARAEVRAEWSQAYCDGRIRKSRPRQGRRTVTIEPKAE